MFISMMLKPPAKMTLPVTNISRPRKWMVGIRSFPLGARPIFMGEVLVLERVIITKQRVLDRPKLGGGNSNIFYFHPYPGEMIQFDQYVSKGLKPPSSFGSSKKSRGWSVWRALNSIGWALQILHFASWMINATFPPRNKALIAGLIKWNQWLIWERIGKFMDILGGGNSKYFLNFHPDPWGFMIQFD